MCKGCQNCRVSSAQLRKLHVHQVDASCWRCCCPVTDLWLEEVRPSRDKRKRTTVMPAMGAPTFGKKVDDPEAPRKVCDVGGAP